MKRKQSGSFGNYFLRAQRINPDWREYYIDYKKFKLTFYAFKKRRRYVRNLVVNGILIYESDLMLQRAPKSFKSLLKSQNFEMVYKKSWEKITLEVNNSYDKSESQDEDGFMNYSEITNENGKVISKIKPFKDERETMLYLHSLERAELFYLIDREVEKVIRFYNQQILVLANYFLTLNIQFSRMDSSDEEIYYYLDDIPHENYKFVGTEILELFAFVAVNVIALRQILLRYDGFVRSFDGTYLSQWYLKGKDYQTCGDYLQDLFHLESLIKMKEAFSMRLHDYPLQNIEFNCKVNSSNVEETFEYFQKFSATFEKFMTFMDKTLYSLEKRANDGNVILQERILTFLRDVVIMNLATIEMRGETFSYEMKCMAKWRETSELPLEVLDANDKKKRLNPENYRPLILILISTFLHFLNIYIVKPSSTKYVMKLGENIALTGAMIGAMTGSSIFSALIFSSWTNKSYLQPIIVSSLSMILGNLLYAQAYTEDSFALLMTGCALTGIGGPCVINRRFFTISTPKNLRTAAGATFAAISCAGAALGPLLVIFYYNMNYTTSLFIFGDLTINVMNGPGYLMSALWFIFIIIIAIAFQEPIRNASSTPPRKSVASDHLNDTFYSVFHLSSVDNEDVDNEEQDLIDFSDDDEHDPLSQVFLQDNSNTCCSVPKLSDIFSPVNLCLLMIFFTDFAAEVIQSATSIIAMVRFQWDVKNIAILDFINLVLIVPTSIFIGWTSQYLDDRRIVLILLPISLISLLLLIDITDLNISCSDLKYSIGNILAFTSLQTCSSVFASSLSKVLPSNYAKSTLNASLLTTVVVSLGKTCGNLFIIAVGFIDLTNILNLLHVPLIFFVIISIILCSCVRFHETGHSNA